MVLLNNSPPASLPDLRPARWLWYPSQRCLANTFVLFRAQVELPADPVRATGWIGADSRYLLAVNGRRIQFGPPPCDPRWLEADPLDLTATLRKGPNAIGATVLFYGHGDGTWPTGKPGFLFWLEIETAGGAVTKIVSDASWKAFYARAWKPGQYKRWFLRALQEEFDARLYPYGWTAPSFSCGDDWLPALELDCPADEPPSTSGYPEYAMDMQGDRSVCSLRPRTIPPMRENLVPVVKLTESMRLRWRRPPEEYFECVTPNAFDVDRTAAAVPDGAGAWRVALDGARSAALTFELAEQIVGWPRFTIEAPAGTIVELLVQEAHRPGGPPLLNTHFHAWARFTCRAGTNEFEAFDFESCRWIQLHIRGPAGEVRVCDVGMRRRQFPWLYEPAIKTSEPALDRLIAASINTIHNSAQETCVDGMGRERQQYSGDGGHQLHAVHLTFGETRLPARFLRTFSQGMTLDGYFLDCWPAYDRLARLMERQLQMSGWGPILDHGVGFNFDCYYHWMYTGDAEALAEPYPRLLRFARYLESLRGRDGLLPVENIGIPSVWIDHVAYHRQRHKGCAFNLYAAAMLEHALPTLCEAVGERDRAAWAREFGSSLRAAAVARFWSAEQKIFINNLPWLGEEGGPRLCDRSLATAVLYDQSPGGATGPAIEALATCPPTMGFSYPCNAGWRLWALGEGGRPEPILKDLRERWATMDSVALNNTIQEDWTAAPDSGSQWSHCAVAPLFVLTMSIAGVKPLEPGFARVEIRPQLGDLERLDLTVHTVRGPIVVRSRGKKGDRQVAVSLPAACDGELVVAEAEKLALERVPRAARPGLGRYRLPAGVESLVTLLYG